MISSPPTAAQSLISTTTVGNYTNTCYVLAVCSAWSTLCASNTFVYFISSASVSQYCQPKPAKNTTPVCVWPKHNSCVCGWRKIYTVCYACLVLHTLKAWRAASPCPDSISSLALLPIMVAPSSSSGSNLANVSNSSAPFIASSSAYKPSISLPSSKG